MKYTSYLSNLILISLFTLGACSNREQPQEPIQQDSVVAEKKTDSLESYIVDSNNTKIQASIPFQAQSKYTIPLIKEQEEESIINQPIPESEQTIYRANAESMTGPDMDEIETPVITNTVEQMPSFGGGQNALLYFIEDNVIYPETAREKSIQGTSKVNFVVDKDGKVKDVKIGQSSGNYDLDTEAMRVIKLTSGRWIPARVNGKYVSYYYTIPIVFQLNY